MRRKDRELTGRENIEPILQTCKTLRLAMISEGRPYVVPLNFGYTWDDNGLTIYIHSGLKGKKIDALRADPHVCFEMDIEDGLTGQGGIACKHSYAFSSIVGEGIAEFVENNDQKRQGFDVIMRHLTGHDGWEYDDIRLSVTEVLRIQVLSFEASRKQPK